MSCMEYWWLTGWVASSLEDFSCALYLSRSRPPAWRLRSIAKNMRTSSTIMAGLWINSLGFYGLSIELRSDMGVEPKNRGVENHPKWMVKIMENPMNKGMIWGVFPSLFLVQHPYISNLCYNSSFIVSFTKHLWKLLYLASVRPGDFVTLTRHAVVAHGVSGHRLFVVLLLCLKNAHM